MDEEKTHTEAFLQEAMEQYGSTVYRTAISMTANQSDAEDVYQDVFLRLLRSQTDFSDEKYLKAWLLRVTVNRCHDYTRLLGRHRETPFDELFEADTAAEPEETHIWELLQSLPPKLRAVVYQFYFEGYSTEEIAAIFQCRPSTVRSWLHRARKKLKIELGGISNESGTVQVAIPKD